MKKYNKVLSMVILNDVSKEEWIERHKGLRVVQVACASCGKTLSSTLPFVSQGYVGLTTPLCSCGSELTKAESAIPRTAAERASWEETLDRYHTYRVI